MKIKLLLTVTVLFLNLQTLVRGEVPKCRYQDEILFADVLYGIPLCTPSHIDHPKFRSYSLQMIDEEGDYNEIFFVFDITSDVRIITIKNKYSETSFFLKGRKFDKWNKNPNRDLINEFSAYISESLNAIEAYYQHPNIQF
jgi:hypothetical protein